MAKKHFFIVDLKGHKIWSGFDEEQANCVYSKVSRGYLAINGIITNSVGMTLAEAKEHVKSLNDEEESEDEYY